MSTNDNETYNSVYYNLNGGEGITEVNWSIDPGCYHTVISDVPTREGYTFMGWKDDDGVSYWGGDAFYGGELVAQWQEIPVGTITFDLNGGTGDFPTEVSYTGEYIVPEVAPIKEGCNFIAWSGSDGCYYSLGSRIVGGIDVTLTADWYVIPVGTITFDLNGGTGDFPPISFRFGEWPTIPTAVPTKYRCQFYGWDSTSGHYFYPGYTYEYANEQDTLIANWSPELYVMTFDSDGGYYDYPTIEQPPETDFPFFTPTKEGYNFIHWVDEDGNTYVEGDWYIVQAKDMTFTAVWEHFGYVVDYDGGYGHEVVEIGNSHIVTSNVPTREGYDFVCWKHGEDSYNAGDLITPTEDIVFFPEWTPRHYTVNFDLDGGTGEFSSLDKVHDISLTLPETIPEKSGFVFCHWVDSLGNTFDAGSAYSVEGNNTLTAIWEEIFTITYLNADGTTFFTYSALDGTETTIIEDTPEAHNKAFAFWQISDGYQTYMPSDTIVIHESITLVPQFRDVNYLLYYVDGECIQACDKIQGIDTEIFDYIPEKAGYQFFCWKLNGYNNYYFPGDIFTYDETLSFNAIWTPIGNVKIVYDTLHAKEEIGEFITTSGETIAISSTIPVKEGYVFKGWTDALDSQFEAGTPINIYQPGSTLTLTESKRLRAVWERDYNPTTRSYDIANYGRYSVNVRTGNFIAEFEDLSWQGARMPVTIKHVYNSSLKGCQYTYNPPKLINSADFSKMNVGKGFMLSLMQGMKKLNIVHSDGIVSSYVYTDENGNETYFVYNEEESYYDEFREFHEVYKEKGDADMYYTPDSHIMTSGEESYEFDSYGRLVKIFDKYSSLSINYNSDKITSVTDGSNRVFSFEYTDSNLTKIIAPDNTHTDYSYDENGNLTKIVYPDGTSLNFEYDMLTVTVKDSNGNEVLNKKYDYMSDDSYYFREIGYTDGSSVKGKSSFFYTTANGESTRVFDMVWEDAEENLPIEQYITHYYFNDDGSVKSQNASYYNVDNIEDKLYLPEGSVTYGDEVNIKSKSFSDNLLLDHNAQSLTNWNIVNESSLFTVSAISETTDNKSKFGQKYFELASENDSDDYRGMYQTVTLPAGEYTYSAYFRISVCFESSENVPGAFLEVKNSSGTRLSKSEVINSNDEIHNRIATSFTLESETTVKVYVGVYGKGTARVDGLQLEQNPYATSYNMLENGSFESSCNNGWHTSSGISRYLSTGLRMPCMLCITGNSSKERYVYQTVPVKIAQNTRETFTLSGWAKGTGSANANATYRLRAIINYADGETEEHTVDFSPSISTWQYASMQFCKEKYKEVNNLTVYCDYDYQSGSAFFDAIELTRDYIEFNLTQAEFEGTDSSSSSSGVEIEEAKDSFGNVITETTHTNNFTEGVIYRSFEYDESGNNLVKETDPRGNTTTYTVDETTSRNTQVKDRCGNKTYYTYDSMGKVTRIENRKANNTSLSNVNYSYNTLGNITEIVRGDGLKYVLSYDPFGNLESIGVNERESKLVTYVRRDNNGRIKRIAYANGDYMKASYNRLGYMTSEKWYDSSDTLKYEYIYAYDNEGNIIKTIDNGNNKEYNYLYDEGNLVRSTEYDVSDGTKTRVATVYYMYDGSGELARKRIVFADENQLVYTYVNTENTNSAYISSTGSNMAASFTSSTATDNLGRKATDTLDALTKTYTYHSGKATQEHKDNNLNLGHATTQLVENITYSNGESISYTYDKEERIVGVTSGTDDITEYTYDALGQLTG